MLMTLPWALCVVAAILMHHVVGPVVGDYWVTVLQKIGVFIIAAVGLNIVNGFTGQFSMGHAGFMAVGGYIAGATTYYGSLLWIGTVEAQPGLFNAGIALMIAGVFLGAFVAAGFGYLVGLPSLRLRGDYLAIVTLGFGEIIRVLLQQTGEQVAPTDAARFAAAPLKILSQFPLNGALGFTRVPQYASVFWVYLFAAVTLLVAYRVKYSSSGRAFLSIREDEIAARAMGIHLTKYKVRAFVLAAFFGGVAGGLWAHAGQNFSPTEAGFQRSFEVIILVVLGGLGSISGAAMAAIALTALTEVLRGPGDVLAQWWQLLALAGAVGVVAIVLRALRNTGWRVIAIGAAIPAGLVAFAKLSDLTRNHLGISLGDYRMVLYALALILVMLLRPNGLLGVRELWDLFSRASKRSSRTNGGAA